MLIETQTIGVIGHTGMVGSEAYSYYKRHKYPVYGISTNHKSGFPESTWEEINDKCDIIFVCVPTPYDFAKKKANFTIVNEVVKKVAPNKIVVLKSTVWPGFTEKLQKKYSKLYILFNPEFLSRKTARADFEIPDRQILGYTSRSKPKTQEIMSILPKGKYQKIVKASDAELIKYAHNVFGAIRIIYANHLYEVCKKLKGNYENVRDGFAASEFIGPGILRYMTIFHNDKRGYGGPCFPKDVNSYIEFCDTLRVPAELIKATRSANRRILKEQHLTEHKVEKY
ncbi:hypothetical protein A2715_04895 [Candidatus Woesebacteria bacterium RIFCSPHIGHO2_01_FULL_39_32]|uniref:UDP-glucose/GDP-mannose dehydrogenase dimerisation domain-containing protein n=1 Tax=Candidatus Woesebacteria bacterium RIFCSPLOWO2_01_FULL_39_25 TaxID=1802521 RepID=A0A1F8BLE3_9BACT|nr:MAG: hypothetical protein A2124_00820 [Candidatus Woesebacteria bacterium GWB1_37_5]OGM25356.1 MAG: hypothetical protein A2715_04895 [Candidatus Woesebacteria bacterium RIFCSPHIGHO2_01_FULL_39_32]OGM37855.1 MAG: hypothetical protein A3F01_02105 [Candidatus Woesebacteria bacterium RIFCSPHIGHO2_12_FULL_38_11]OGM64887.1 MAG: hypothetical protein A2893_04505 [Candidatus Woesebacteria bacterium RIFCSPLOWO2_01_FULL_39_25]